MQYQIILSPTAEDDINNAPVEAQAQIIDELERVAESPVALSRSSRPTAECPGYQIHEFCAYDNVLYKIFFKYSQDETALHVARVARVPYG